jgi:hypothetical protein
MPYFPGNIKKVLILVREFMLHKPVHELKFFNFVRYCKLKAITYVTGRSQEYPHLPGVEPES